MTRQLAKPHLRVVGIDDGPFSRRGRSAPVVGVVYSVPGYVEGLLRTTVRVDGADAGERIATMLLRSPFLDGIRVVLVDGIAVGGFNLIDLDALAAAVGRPVVSVTRRPPDFAAMRRALRTYFPRDLARRWAIVRAHRLFRVPTADGARVLASAVGLNRAQAASVVRRTTVRGAFPEPIRLAHLVARVLATRSSRSGTVRSSGGKARRPTPTRRART